MHLFVCVHTLSVSRPMKGLGLIGGFQTSVALTPMNHTAPGSTCACGCEACLSKLMLCLLEMIQRAQSSPENRNTPLRHGMHLLLD